MADEVVPTNPVDVEKGDAKISEEKPRKVVSSHVPESSYVREHTNRLEHGVAFLASKSAYILENGLFYTVSVIMSINFIMLLIGSFNVHNCPAEPKIPIFLIVSGSLGILASILTNARIKNILTFETVHFVETVLYLAAFGTIIAGAVWTYGVWVPELQYDGITYCNPFVYVFSFVYVSVILSLFLVVASILVICALVALSSYINYHLKGSDNFGELWIQ